MAARSRQRENINITKQFVDAPTTTNGGKGQRIYWDRAIRGFGLRVGNKYKAFIIQREVKGRNVLVTLGRYGALTVDAARKEAQQIIAKMTTGENPNAEKRAARARGITLQTAWEEYRDMLRANATSRVDQHGRSRTERDFEYSVTHYLKEWLHKPLAEIQPTDVRALHKRIAAAVAKRYAEREQAQREKDVEIPVRPHLRPGATTANHAMHAFRAIYNYARDNTHRMLSENPVGKGLWLKTKKPRTAIPEAALPGWYKAVQAMTNKPTRRDYLLFVLLTGLRRTNAMEVEWKHVDLERKKLHVPVTKSGEPFDIPLSTALIDLLAARRKADPAGRWVFPAESASGHIEEPREGLAGVSTIVVDGQLRRVTVHDLRRTFLSIAESLDISPYALKALVNHRQPSEDVTGGYISLGLERLRGPMQRISDHIMTICVDNSKKVVSLDRERKHRDTASPYLSPRG